MIHDSKMDRNCLVVIIVARSRAPYSRIVYRIHSCPHEAAVDNTSISVSDSRCLKTNLIASPMEESRKRQKEEMTIEQKFTQNTWLKVSIRYPLKSFSWNVVVKPSKPR